MKVTAVEFEPARTTIGTILALATIVFDNEFIVKDLGVMDSEHGLFVSYPHDVFSRCTCQPITTELREHIENTVLEAYKKKVAND